MPSAVWVPEYAITREGREVAFEVLFYVIWDLFDFGHITEWEYEDYRYWIQSYCNGGALPSGRSFKCPWCGEQVGFPSLLDGLYNLYCAGMDAEDVTVSEEEEEDPEDGDDFDIWWPWPTNVGQYKLLPH